MVIFPIVSNVQKTSTLENITTQIRKNILLVRINRTLILEINFLNIKLHLNAQSVMKIVLGV